ncbi:hypothetical protein JTB14_017217 [Gonioctena quinquepunctata]|nr:hypothetical protein JTB14_017217 [Gonioctena quinquepunctata]
MTSNPGFKLKNDEVKQQIYSKKELLKGTGIIIREDLTKSRVELLDDTISKFGLKQVWTESGKIYLNTDNKATMIRGLPGDTRETRKVSLTTLIKKNLENYMTTGTPLYKSRERIYIQYENKNNKETLKKIIDTKIAEYDVRGAIRILTSEEGLAPFDQNSLISLREKHPPMRTDPNFPSFESKEETLELDQPTTVNQVEKAIKSFSCGSSGGLDGITPQYLKDLMNDKNDEYGTQLLNSLA